MASPAQRRPSASPPTQRRPSARRPSSLWRAGLLTAAAISVAGCVSMPNSGPVGAITATPQSTAANGTDFIQPLPAGPYAGETPAGIVQGFLTASASYPVNAAVARQYLTSSVSRGWNPGWQVTVFSRFNPTEVTLTPPAKHAAQVAVVGVSGDVQSTFNGSGQFVSAGSQADTQGAWQFTLMEVNGQWRISAPPPPRRLLTVPQFQDFYKPQELYFINPSVAAGASQQPLVPDSVFVPLGTSTTDLVNNLVNALLPTTNGEPKSSLLQRAADTFPAGTKLAGVTQTGSTAVVNLDGLAGASTAVKEQVSAQLAWTLASPRAGPAQPIQSVQLEINGSPWTPPPTICGITQHRSPVQNQATYPCYNPYPSQPANFSFTSQGQVWSRCGSEASVQGGLIGPVLSALHPASATSLQGCDSGAAVHTNSASRPAAVQLPGIGTPTLAAISPDGQYVAVYSPGNPAGKELSLGLASSHGRLSSVPGIGSGVTAISWDRNQDLWVAENGDVFMVPVDGKAVQVNTVPPDVSDLSVAPDGVRIAFIVQDGSASVVDIAAIIRASQSSPGQLGSPSAALPVSQPVQVGPDLVQPTSLTWYDAGDLIVLAGSSAPTLSEVPVDGQESSSSQPAPSGAVSITADGDMNALVAGISGGTLAVSTGLEGPWQPLGVPGQNPAYAG